MSRASVSTLLALNTMHGDKLLSLHTMHDDMLLSLNTMHGDMWHKACETHHEGRAVISHRWLDGVKLCRPILMAKKPTPMSW